MKNIKWNMENGFAYFRALSPAEAALDTPLHVPSAY